jgi:hypothetical protein
MCDIGDFEAASTSYVKVLKSLKKELGEKAIFADALSDAAECMRQLGKFDEARAFLAKAYSIQKEIGGHTYIGTITTLMHTTHLQMDADELPQYQRALNSMETIIAPNLVKMLGEAHPLNMYNNANIGLCKNAIVVNLMEKEDLPALKTFLGADHELVTKFEHEMHRAKEPDFLDTIDLPGQSLITELVTYLESYPQLKFTPDHPWFFRFSALYEDEDMNEEINGVGSRAAEGVKSSTGGADRGDNVDGAADSSSPSPAGGGLSKQISAKRMLVGDKSRPASPNTNTANLQVKLKSMKNLHASRAPSKDEDDLRNDNNVVNDDAAQDIVSTDAVGAAAAAESNPQ